jgi:hypothetical protein
MSLPTIWQKKTKEYLDMKHFFLSHRSTRIALSLVALLTLSLLSSTAAFASTPGATVDPGEIAAHGTFYSGSAITLNGSDQLHQDVGTLAIIANDFSGNGLGWTVQTSADPLTATGHPSLTTALSTTTTLACAVLASTCLTDGVSASSTDTTLDGSAHILATADAPSSGTSYGMGSYKFTDTVFVDFPANIFQGSYTTTIDLTMAPPV